LSRNMDLKIDWFPFDMPDTIGRAVAVIAPKVLVLLETELWPGLLHCLKQKGARILVVNARMSKKSFGRYYKTGCLWEHLAPDLILAVSEQDRDRFQMVFKPSKVKTMPNMKFESIETEPAFSAFGQEKIILPGPLPLTILASVRRQEEKQGVLLLKKLLDLFPHQVVAVFPRHMGRLPSWEKCLPPTA
nr:3-deoxy-D-manno-octulosonic acid transferase [Desulfobacula sp.]